MIDEHLGSCGGVNRCIELGDFGLVEAPAKQLVDRGKERFAVHVGTSLTAIEGAGDGRGGIL